MDLCYLVEHIWVAQSLLSGEKELAELVLIRWNVHIWTMESMEQVNSLSLIDVYVN